MAGIAQGSSITSSSAVAPMTRSANWAGLPEASLMTALAGYVDAVGYTATGHLYLSFMSGNSTQFGMAVAHGDRNMIGWAGAVIAAFVVGAFAGSLVARIEARANLPLVLAAELLLFLAAWALLGMWPANVALLLVAVAMGMQNAIGKSVAGASVGKSYITGTLYGVGNTLARSVLGTARWTAAAADAISWLAFVGGVTCGTVMVAMVGLATALLGSVLVLLALITASLIRRSSSGRAGRG